MITKYFTILSNLIKSDIFSLKELLFLCIRNKMNKNPECRQMKNVYIAIFVPVKISPVVMTNALWPYWYPSTKFIFFSAILFPSGTRVMCCWEGIAQWTVWQATCHLYKVKVLTKYANWFHQATNNTDFKLLPWLFNSGCRVVKQEAELAETTDVLQSFLQSAEKKSRCSSAFYIAFTLVCGQENWCWL